MRTLRIRAGSGEGHGGEVFSCVYSRDGAFVLSAGWDGCLRLWQSGTGQLISSLRTSVKPLSACAIAPSGSTWVSGAMDGYLSWWDAVSHQMRLNFLGHIRPISAIEYSPDGLQVATASWDRKIQLRCIGQEREGLGLNGHQDIVAGCRWLPDGKQLLSWSHDGTLRLWDVETACEIARLTGHADRVTAAHLSQDGRWVVSGGRDGSLKLWDLGRHEEVGGIKLNSEVRGCWHLHDHSAAALLADGWLALWSLPNFELEVEVAGYFRAQCCDLSPTGTDLVIGSESGELHFATIEGGEQAPLPVAATPIFKPKSGVITRFLGKQKISRSYQYTCPVCSQTAETPDLPREAIPCASCHRLLRLTTDAGQLQNQAVD
jgi:WD40 repeat protein